MLLSLARFQNKLAVVGLWCPYRTTPSPILSFSGEGLSPRVLSLADLSLHNVICQRRGEVLGYKSTLYPDGKSHNYYCSRGISRCNRVRDPLSCDIVVIPRVAYEGEWEHVSCMSYVAWAGFGFVLPFNVNFARIIMCEARGLEIHLQEGLYHSGVHERELSNVFLGIIVVDHYDLSFTISCC